MGYGNTTNEMICTHTSNSCPHKLIFNQIWPSYDLVITSAGSRFYCLSYQIQLSQALRYCRSIIRVCFPVSRVYGVAYNKYSWNGSAQQQVCGCLLSFMVSGQNPTQSHPLKFAHNI